LELLVRLMWGNTWQMLLACVKLATYKK
jgi:hypothetical protein